ncbi:hypothetical protein [Streptomyces sp. NPDC127108]|uniref:hypothetical protein n=1 Tax=Streptomyces sp. NPDC127108 TaxID=3345361 RepID=UPI0036253891
MNPTTSDPGPDSGPDSGLGFDEWATRAYGDYLGHLSGCPSCRRTDYCAVGDRMRRAWKAAQGAAARAHRR